MSRLSYEDLEIVGFNGAVLVECEPVLPVVRVKDSDRYFLLEAEHDDPSSVDDIDSESLDFSTRSQIESLAERGLLTLLGKSFPAFANAVIAYVNREFLTLADATIPDAVYSQQLTEDVSVIAGTNIAIEEILDAWATRIMDQSTLKLEQFLADKNEQFRASAEHFADLAICAASNRALRASIYMREGLAIMLSHRPERLDNFYRTSVQAEFQDWSWNGFHEQLRRLADVLRVRAKYLTSDAKAAASVTTRRPEPAPVTSTKSNESSDLSEITELVEVSAAIGRIEDFQERYILARNNAERYRCVYTITEEIVERVAGLMIEASKVRLDNDILRPLRGDPLIYLLGERALTWPRRNGEPKEPRPLLQNYLYIDEAQKIQGLHLDPGELATKAVEKYEDRQKITQRYNSSGGVCQ